jgi:hypothetical protein
VTGEGFTIGEGGIGATLPLDQVRELIVTLGKALRASQLYDENNPVYKRFVQALADEFVRLWAEVDELVLHVNEEALLLEGEEVYSSRTKSDSLAFLLYKDGVRIVHFTPGFEREVPRFLDVLNQARHARQDDEDLLTLLWEAEFTQFTYRYVDLLAEGVDLPEAGIGADQSELEQALEEARAEDEAAVAGEPAAEQPPATVSQEDFNPTLYALDATEMEALRRSIQEEHERDVRGGVIDALFDRFEDGDPDRRDEIFEIVDGLLPAFMARGEIASATRILRQLRSYELANAVSGPHQERITQLLDRLSATETLHQLIEAIEVGTIDPDPGDLAGFLGFLRGGALGVLVRATFDTESLDLKRILGGSVETIARRDAEAVRELLASDDDMLAAAAARIVADQRIESAAGGLRDLLFSAHANVRHAAVQAVGALRVPTLMGAVVELLDDIEPEIRIEAARVLGSAQYRAAAQVFREILDSRAIRQADRREKISFFEAYGRLGDPGAEDRLDKYLNGRGFLGRRESSEIRAAAALGLGRIGSSEALMALDRASDDDDAVVRSAVSRALSMAPAGGDR